MAALRPKGGLSDGKRDRRSKSYPTHSCLTMDENAMTLVNFCFNEGYACNEVAEDVLFLAIVDFDLLVSEGLSER